MTTSGEPDRNATLFGKLAIARRLVTEKQLEECLAIQSGDAGKRLGEIFVERGYMTSDEVFEIIRLQQTRFGARGPGAPAMALGFHKGDEVDGFSIEREVDTGGLGCVFEVSSRGERYAMKVLDAEVTTEFGTRFREAARRIALGERPASVAQVVAEGELHGQSYVVSEWLGGGSLGDMLSQGPMQWRDASNIACQVAEALRHSHALGVVHGDVRPRKIHLRTDGTVGLRDFGLAPLAGRAEAVTRRKDLYYLAPEQLLEGQALDSRVDVYGLGASLYQMLSGRRPFQGQGSALFEAILRELPERIRKSLPTVPAEAEAICFQAIGKSVEHRYQDVTAMLGDLRRLERGEKVRAKSIRETRIISRWLRRLASRKRR